jgi:hypothetical protein
MTFQNLTGNGFGHWGRGRPEIMSSFNSTTPLLYTTAPMQWLVDMFCLYLSVQQLYRPIRHFHLGFRVSFGHIMWGFGEILDL